MAVEPAEPAEPVAVVPDWSSAPLPEGSEFGGGSGGHWAVKYFGGPSLLARALAGFRRPVDLSKWNLWRVSILVAAVLQLWLMVSLSELLDDSPPLDIGTPGDSPAARTKLLLASMDLD